MQRFWKSTKNFDNEVSLNHSISTNKIISCHKIKNVSFLRYPLTKLLIDSLIAFIEFKYTLKLSGKYNR